MDESHVFECVDHARNAFKTLYSFYANQELVDITLYFCEGDIEAHRFVLSMNSVIFKNMLLKDPPPAAVFFGDISKEVMLKILDFMYTGHVIVQDNMKAEFLKATKHLQVKGIDCEEQLSEEALCVANVKDPVVGQVLCGEEQLPSTSEQNNQLLDNNHFSNDSLVLVPSQKSCWEPLPDQALCDANVNDPVVGQVICGEEQLPSTSVQNKQLLNDNNFSNDSLVLVPSQTYCEQLPDQALCDANVNDPVVGQVICGEKQLPSTTIQNKQLLDDNNFSNDSLVLVPSQTYCGEQLPDQALCDANVNEPVVGQVSCGDEQLPNISVQNISNDSQMLLAPSQKSCEQQLPNQAIFVANVNDKVVCQVSCGYEQVPNTSAQNKELSDNHFSNDSLVLVPSQKSTSETACATRNVKSVLNPFALGANKLFNNKRKCKFSNENNRVSRNDSATNLESYTSDSDIQSTEVSDSQLPEASVITLESNTSDSDTQITKVLDSRLPKACNKSKLPARTRILNSARVNALQSSTSDSDTQMTKVSDSQLPKAGNNRNKVPARTRILNSARVITLESNTSDSDTQINKVSDSQLPRAGTKNKRPTRKRLRYFKNESSSERIPVTGKNTRGFESTDEETMYKVYPIKKPKNDKNKTLVSRDDEREAIEKQIKELPRNQITELCVVCYKYFYEIVDHIKMNHRRPIPRTKICCKDCGKQFYRRVFLDHHKCIDK